MPAVTIRILAPMSEQLGLARDGKRAMLEMAFEPGACIRSVIMFLTEQYPAFRTIALDPVTGRLIRQILLTVNGQLLTEPDAYDMPLKEHDEIVLLPMIAGG